MISLKRRREIVQEIREFHEVWTYGLPHPGPSKHTAEERDWVMQWAINDCMNLWPKHNNAICRAYHLSKGKSRCCISDEDKTVKRRGFTTTL
jgi:hypothetical protein